MTRATVFIVDDDPSVRDSLSLLLSLHGRTSATFASAEDFLAALDANAGWRGCVVADLRMPGMSGLELQHALKARGLALPVVVVTGHGDVAAARQAFLAQAVDFLEKPFDTDALLDAIDRALATLPPTDAASDAAGAPAALSPREREVMALLVEGHGNREIADALGISHRTVEVHKARVLDKLGARSVVELVRRAAVPPPA